MSKQNVFGARDVVCPHGAFIALDGEFFNIAGREFKFFFKGNRRFHRRMCSDVAGIALVHGAHGEPIGFEIQSQLIQVMRGTKDIHKTKVTF